MSQKKEKLKDDLYLKTTQKTTKYYLNSTTELFMSNAQDEVLMFPLLDISWIQGWWTHADLLCIQGTPPKNQQFQALLILKLDENVSNISLTNLIGGISRKYLHIYRAPQLYFFCGTPCICFTQTISFCKFWFFLLFVCVVCFVVTIYIYLHIISITFIHFQFIIITCLRIVNTRNIFCNSWLLITH